MEKIRYFSASNHVRALSCPRQESIHIVKNGRIHHGRQNNKCKVYGKQSIQNLTKKVIGQNTRDLIDKLLLERLSLAGIPRITGVSQWLQTYVNKKSKMTPPQIKVDEKKRGD